MENRGDGQREQLVQELNDHIQNYPVNITFPASVSNSDSGNSNSQSNEKKSKPIRTDPEVVNLKLLESGLLFEDGQNLSEASASIADFVSTMKNTGCYDNVQVRLSLDQNKEVNDDNSNEGESNKNRALPCSINVELEEKKWYKLYVGGGIKQDSLTNSTNIPKVQFETNASLINLRGLTDKTTLSYSIDQSAATEIFLSHDTPLFSIFPKYSTLYNYVLLSQEKGTEPHFSARAGIHMDDYEWTSSYKQLNRGIQLIMSNCPGVPDMVSGTWNSLTYFLSFRDIIPRRHPTLPYACDASPDIVSQAGPNLKHSLQYCYQTNGQHTDNRYNPTEGIDYFLKTEIAGPPGDTGFFKAEGGISFHSPIFKALESSTENGLTFHAGLHGGMMKTLNFGGLCYSSSCISDRFFTGGPLLLRGFQPSGIGPRANSGGRSVSGGDALGGEVYYTSNVSVSVPSPIFSDLGVRWFGFVNAGTLSGYGVPLGALMKSTRMSLGGGACFASPFGRVEATYAVPLRYGPKDVRKQFQFGFGFSFD